jgi:hypothetical protein
MSVNSSDRGGEREEEKETEEEVAAATSHTLRATHLLVVGEMVKRRVLEWFQFPLKERKEERRTQSFQDGGERGAFGV